jgi:hypothetical protein
MKRKSLISQQIKKKAREGKLQQKQIMWGCIPDFYPSLP